MYQLSIQYRPLGLLASFEAFGMSEKAGGIDILTDGEIDNVSINFFEGI